MSDFSDVAAIQSAAIDPTRHVNYTLGMVLGVDDFTQEYAYLANRDQLAVRGLHGYGTVCGLDVRLAGDAGDPQVVVAPGLAVTPRGQFVAVPATQGAQLNAWLQSHAAAVQAALDATEPTAPLPLFVVLCYRECLTDPVPIPGEPCRSEEEAMAASRIADDFRLELRLVPPQQREYDRTRRFVGWLNHMQVVPAEADALDADAFLAAAQAALGDGDVAPAQVHAGDAPGYLAAAFRLWSTTLRPQALGAGASPAGDPPDEECVLLAQLTVQVAAGPAAGSVALDESRRPYLLTSQFQQEWVHLLLRSATAPAETVVAAESFGLSPEVGAAMTFARADHSHGTPPDPMPAHVADTAGHANHGLAGDVTGTLGAASVERLRGIPVVYGADSPAPGQVLTFTDTDDGGLWQPQTPAAPGDGGGPVTLAGDVTGPSRTTVVTGLQGFPIQAPAATAAGQVLTFQGDDWQLRPATTAAIPTDLVRHPTGLSPYFIVAAGVLTGKGIASVPTYNGLTAELLGEGEVRFTFNNFMVLGQTQYIVKALLQVSREVRSNFGLRGVDLFVDRFEESGFVLSLSAAGEPVSDDALAELVFIIEVSQYVASR